MILISKITKKLKSLKVIKEPKRSTLEDLAFVFKICLIGNGRVGKTCIARRLCLNTFDMNTKMTIGIDFYNYRLPIIITGKKRYVSLIIWDFGGEEQFKKLFKYYISGANGIFLVFDLSDLNRTLLGLEWWIEQLKAHNHQETPKILVGTKYDLVKGSTTVDSLIIENFREKYGNLPFYETSSKKNYNIKLIFKELIKLILNKNEFEYDKIL